MLRYVDNELGGNKMKMEFLKFLNKIICRLLGHKYQERFFEPTFESIYNKEDTIDPLGFYCIRCGKKK